MKEQKKLICIIAAIIIIAGVIVGSVKGFNIELSYLSRKQMVLVSEKEINIKEIEDIAKEILTDRKVKVQEVDLYGKSAEITATSISEDEKNEIINKVNEKYEISIEADAVQITEIPNTRVRDILKPYILPAFIAFVITLLYFVIIYNTIGLKDILLKAICMPVITELLFYSIVAITRIPFGRVVNSIALGVYVLNIIGLSAAFQKEKADKLKDNEKENDK